MWRLAKSPWTKKRISLLPSRPVAKSQRKLFMSRLMFHRIAIRRFPNGCGTLSTAMIDRYAEFIALYHIYKRLNLQQEQPKRTESDAVKIVKHALDSVKQAPSIQRGFEQYEKRRWDTFRELEVKRDGNWQIGPIRSISLLKWRMFSVQTLRRAVDDKNQVALKVRFWCKWLASKF